MGVPRKGGSQVTTGSIVLCSKFCTRSNPHVDRCSTPPHWDPPSLRSLRGAIAGSSLAMLYNTILYYTTILCIIVLLYYTILYYTILYYTILYYTILYYTILYCQVSERRRESALPLPVRPRRDRVGSNAALCGGGWSLQPAIMCETITGLHDTTMRAYNQAITSLQPCGTIMHST